MTYFLILLCVWFVAFFLTSQLVGMVNATAKAKDLANVIWSLVYIALVPFAVTFLFHQLS